MKLFLIILCCSCRPDSIILVTKEASSNNGGSGCRDPQPNNRQSIGNPEGGGEEGISSQRFQDTITETVYRIN